MQEKIPLYSLNTNENFLPYITYDKINEMGGLNIGILENREDLYELMTMQCIIFSWIQIRKFTNVSFSIIELFSNSDNEKIMREDYEKIFSYAYEIEKLNEKDIKVFLLNEDNKHWLCVIIDDFDKKIILFDPKKSNAFGYIGAFLQNLCKINKEFELLKNDKIDFQVGGEECGPITLEFIHRALLSELWKNDFIRADFGIQAWIMLQMFHQNLKEINYNFLKADAIELISISDFRQDHLKMLKSSSKENTKFEILRNEIQELSEKAINSKNYIQNCIMKSFVILGLMMLFYYFKNFLYLCISSMSKFYQGEININTSIDSELNEEKLLPLPEVFVFLNKKCTKNIL